MAYTVLDVSTFNNITDYNSAVSGLSGVILRVGYRGYGSSGTLCKDGKFNQHYNGFVGKIPIGVYFLSQAVNETEARAEVNYIYNIIKNLDIRFPIYLDSEWSNANHTGRADGLTKAQRSVVVNAFCDRCRELGYKGGVYASDSWFKYQLNLSTITPHVDSFWVAKYSSYKPSVVTSYDGWQYTSTGRISGYSGSVDLSYFYKEVWKPDTPVYEKDISKYNYNISPTSFIYNGKQQNPNSDISALIYNTDYTVSIPTSINVGTYSIILKGINNYNGTINENYKINPAELNNNLEIKLEYDSYIYTGSEIKPKIISAKNNIGNLILNKDYTVSYKNNINVGTGEVIITGKTNFSGTASTKFTITKKSLSYIGMHLEGYVYKYTGSQIKPKAYINDDSLVEGTDYKVEYYNNINPGYKEAIVKIIGINNYTGEMEDKFSISKMIISDCEVTLSQYQYTYNGKECKPSVKVIDPTLNNITITDYNIEYIDNINAGTAKVKVIGKGEYSGEEEISFTINPKGINGLAVSLEYYECEYTGTNIKPKAYLGNLIEGKDYSTTYVDNINVGMARVVLKGINNYTGETSTIFTINYRDISTITAKYGFATLKSIYRVEDNTFKLYTETYNLEENKDYILLDKSSEPIDDFLLVSLEVKGLGGFSGSYIFRFRIILSEPSYIIDYNDDGTYNFGDIEEQDETAEGNYDFGSLDNIESISLLSDDEDFGELPEDEPTVVVDGANYDFDEFAMLYTADYDIDDGKTINEKGQAIYDDFIFVPSTDDGVYNFGDIDEQDETAKGDYDFGDLDEGVDIDTVAADDYDFNVLAGDATEEQFIPGTEYNLDNVPLYANYCSTTSTTEISGIYYIYNSKIANNRIRVCKYDSGIEVPCRYSGWVNIEDLANSNEISVGDLIEVTGKMYRYANGYGGYTEYEKEVFYVTEIVTNGDNEFDYTYPYGISKSPRGSRLGFVDKDSIKILANNY